MQFSSTRAAAAATVFKAGLIGRNIVLAVMAKTFSVSAL